MKNHLIGLAVAATLVSTASSAFAADMAVKASPTASAPISSWTGFYLGINAGAAWWSSSMGETVTGTALPANVPLSFGSPGSTQAAAGFQAGYNWQFSPQWVAGIEGDFSFTSISNHGPIGFPFPALPGNTATMSEDVRWMATARGKFGYVLGSTLWYVTGGAAWNRVDYRGTTLYAAPPANSNTSFSKTNTGWVAGGGVELMATQHVLLRLEYLYYGFPGVNASTLCTVNGAPVCGPPDLTARYTWNSNTIQEIRAALSYKF